MRTITLLFLSGISAAAQDSAAIPVNLPGQTQTTGMVGITFSQTARLNALNAAAPLPYANPLPSRPCKVTLQFFDDHNNPLSNPLVVDNLNPETATSLDYPRPLPVVATPPIPARIELRGVVTVSTTPPPTPVVLPWACTVVPTLEVFENDSGKTTVVLTNTSFIATGPMPLMGATVAQGVDTP